MLTPHMHNILQTAVTLLGFSLGAVVGGGLVLAANLLLPIESGWTRGVVAAVTTLTGWACAVGAAIIFQRRFRSKVPAECPRCSGKAFAEGWGATRFRCQQCGPLEQPVFREGR